MLCRRHHGFRLPGGGFALVLRLRTCGVNRLLLIAQVGIPLELRTKLKRFGMQNQVQNTQENGQDNPNPENDDVAANVELVLNVVSILPGNPTLGDHRSSCAS